MEAAFHAQQVVRDRQSEIAATLCQSGIPFALSGSNATFEWISSVDRSAARQYRNIELIVTHEDSEKTILALLSIGLAAEVRTNHILFRNDKTRHDRWADKALFFGCKDGVIDVPHLDEIDLLDGLPLIQIARLVEFQLERWTLDDRVDLRDMIDAGIVDDKWLSRLHADVAPRLQELLDNPDG